MAQIVDIPLPPFQEGTQSMVAAWLKQPGDPVKQHEPLVEINTDKAITEVPAPATGVLLEILKHPDQVVSPGESLGRIQVEGGATPPPPAPKAAGAAAAAAPAPALDLSPAVRNLIKQHGLDPARIPGTGRGGRITYEDVTNFLKSGPAAPPEREEEFKGKRVPHTQMRRLIAQHMVQSALRTAPHVTAVFDADLGAVAAHRRQNQEAFGRQGIKLTYTAYFVAAAVRALQAVPAVNGRWHEDSLEVFSDCNIGVVTAVDGGLVVPVLRKAQTLDLQGIAARLQELTDRARRGKVDLADVRHGTFTITNHGTGGSLIATPIIYQPQVAILGIGKVEKRVVVAEIGGADAIQVRPMAYVTLTIDHRALDAHEANSFLTTFVQSLKSW